MYKNACPCQGLYQMRQRKVSVFNGQKIGEVSLFHKVCCVTVYLDNTLKDYCLGIQQSIRSLGFTIPPLISAYISAIDIRFPNLVGGVIVLFAWLIFLLNYKQFKTN